MGLPSYEMKSKRCARCNVWFKPKRGGHNAKYCSKNCKERVNYHRNSVRLTKAEKQKARREAYQRVKSDPEKYKRHLESGRLSIFNIRQWLSDYKTKKGCIDCGYNKHSAALQLDHRGEKTVTISECRSSIYRIQKTIRDENCVVRCAICRSVKTGCERNHIRYRKILAKDYSEEDGMQSVEMKRNEPYLEKVA